MLVSRLAMSYALAMYRAAQEWTRMHQWLTGDALPPLELAQES